MRVVWAIFRIFTTLYPVADDIARSTHIVRMHPPPSQAAEYNSRGDGMKMHAKKSMLCDPT